MRKYLDPVPLIGIGVIALMHMFVGLPEPQKLQFPSELKSKIVYGTFEERPPIQQVSYEDFFQECRDVPVVHADFTNRNVIGARGELFLWCQSPSGVIYRNSYPQSFATNEEYRWGYEKVTGDDIWVKPSRGPGALIAWIMCWTVFCALVFSGRPSDRLRQS